MFQKTKNHLAALIQLKKYNFFLFIFVLFIALFTLFDTTPKRILLQQLNLTSSVPFLWLKSHPQLILAISSFFLFFSAFVTILVCISAKTNTRNYIRFKHLADFLILIYNYFLLFTQILHNIGLFKYGIRELTEYYWYAPKTLGGAVLALMHTLHLLIFFLIILGYLYTSKE